ncbi:Dihydrolipoyllysine-residue succinyltransferase component of 2-oxoglutarate dehydrogenase complex [Poriferisphaera corsica]|uniref:Dihydrolipoyllysine-residue succinyltransferase component of 2-oxoglutarate dehydrogenase complex n=1 Tax=Poriferisphaera corsica TaxID=2528020 RepID=A0A517YXG4_9BACT|nr:2-oxoglutarate dehydrogenase complex dihydrolipoyllysine-residue succinyltransferase [Poriferisphaera corsica]QDU34916.1 Dihydrolipoyllysine-residue succinyltransferase component of 2-oxoglutarate dehydrogenase complex [Poriferisphaera corsica]
MAVELIVPEVGESITEVQIGQWIKKTGDGVQKDDPIVEIETDKVTLELPAPASGTITKLLLEQGAEAKVGDVIGYMEEGEVAAVKTSPETSPVVEEKEEATEAVAEKVAAIAEKKQETETDDAKPSPVGVSKQIPGRQDPRVMPAAQRLLDLYGIQAADVEASGPGGRLLKEDVERHVAWKRPMQGNGATQIIPQPSAPAPTLQPAAEKREVSTEPGREEELVPMTPMRRRIAERLVQAQHSAALLTTFNEIDMTNVMAIRSKYKDAFLKRYDIKLGFMSFFVKAVVDALKQFPAINAEIVGTDVLYKNYYDIGIAVGGGKGLVVPIIRNAERLSFAEIEQAITQYGKAARDNKIKLEELTGGTFTITNGGVYGSMMSTPIINPPQSGVLGMHNIIRRPIAVGQPGKETVEVRPMMYIALTYDHRIVDGREAVSFLIRIKDALEDPSRMLMEI